MPRCQECTRDFVRQSILNRHIQHKHSNVEVLHPCSKCPKLFARLDNLNRHLDNYHGNGLRSCRHCPRKFRQDYLTQHENRCQRKMRLPDEDVLAVAALSTVDSPVPNLKQSATFEGPSHATSDGMSLPALPPFNAESNGPWAFPPSDFSSTPLPTLQQGEGILYNENDSEMIDVVERDPPIYDEANRVRISAWPSLPEHYPEFPPPYMEAFLDLMKYCPHLNITAAMRPRALHTDNGKLNSYKIWDVAVPSGIEVFMYLCIICNDCHVDQHLTDHANLFAQFRAKHADMPSHRRKIRERMMPISKTIMKTSLAMASNDDDGTAPESYVSSLISGNMSTGDLVKEYHQASGKTIFDLALRQNEMSIVAYLVMELPVADIMWEDEPELSSDEEKRCLEFILSCGNLEVLKVLFYRWYGVAGLFGTLLLQRGENGERCIRDVFTQSGKVDETVESIQFFAQLQNMSPLQLACYVGREEPVAAILQAGADPNKIEKWPQPYPLEIALRYASAKAVEKLLEAGARTDKVDTDNLEELRSNVGLRGPSWYRQAEEKLVLLEAYGVNTGR